jgi:hypothetical protein
MVWLVTRLLARLSLEEALFDTQSQMMLSLFWMVCVIMIWSIKQPRSRFMAIGLTLLCAFFVCFLGSVVAFVNWTLAAQTGFSFDNLIAFGMYALLMILAQVFLAIPSAALLQQILLVSVKNENSEAP